MVRVGNVALIQSSNGKNPDTVNKYEHFISCAAVYMNIILHFRLDAKISKTHRQ